MGVMCLLLHALTHSRAGDSSAEYEEAVGVGDELSDFDMHHYAIVVNQV